MDICFQYMLMRIDLVSATQSRSLFDYCRRIDFKFKDFLNFTQKEIRLCYKPKTEAKITIKERALKIESPPMFNATKKNNTRKWLNINQLCLLGYETNHSLIFHAGI